MRCVVGMFLAFFAHLNHRLDRIERGEHARRQVLEVVDLYEPEPPQRVEMPRQRHRRSSERNYLRAVPVAIVAAAVSWLVTWVREYTKQAAVTAGVAATAAATVIAPQVMHQPGPPKLDSPAVEIEEAVPFDAVQPPEQDAKPVTRPGDDVERDEELHVFDASSLSRLGPCMLCAATRRIQAVNSTGTARRRRVPPAPCSGCRGPRRAPR